jgi:hypothetical protein
MENEVGIHVDALSLSKRSNGGVIETIGLFDAGLHYAMDYDYWTRIAKQ